MSYTIEYNRQFIKTKNGYIPCWLHGDNNVTEGWGKNERRCRNWGVFMNWIDVTEEYMLEHIKELYNSYDQHWKKGSTWVTNEGLLRWVKNGCKSAGTIEEIIAVNPYLRNVDCHIVFYDSEDKRQEILKSTITSSKGLEEWLNKVKAFKNSPEYQGCKGFYPVVDFFIEDLKHPVSNKYLDGIEDSDEFVLKNKNGYLVNINGSSSNWAKDIRNATVFKYSEIKELKEKYAGTLSGSWLAEAKLVKAAKKNQKKFVIKFVSGTFSGQYIGNKGKGKINLSYYPSSARQFTSHKAAEKAINDMAYVVQKYGNLEIEEY